MIASDLWCPIIFVTYNEEIVAFTTRAETLARREGAVVDFKVSVPPTDPWFHQLFIQTCYIQLRRH